MNDPWRPSEQPENDEYFTGYRMAEEPREQLRALASPSWETELGEGEIPESVTYQGRVKIESQGSTNSCVGHAASSGAELLESIKLGLMSASDQSRQMSRWFAYIEAQRESGHLGRDQGSTIAGSVKAFTQRGVCREQFAAFTNSYYTRFSDEAYADAEQRQLLRTNQTGNLDQAIKHVGAGLGPVFMGIRWTIGLANASRQTGLGSYTGRSLGGHAVLMTGYNSARGTIEIENSHSLSYGLNGFLLLPLLDAERLFDDPWTVAIGISDLEVPEFRVPHWMSGLKH